MGRGSAWGALIRAQVQLGRGASAESSLARAAAAGLPPATLEAHRALVEILAGRRDAAERALARVPAEAIASDPVRPAPARLGYEACPSFGFAPPLRLTRK